MDVDSEEFEGDFYRVDVLQWSHVLMDVDRHRTSVRENMSDTTLQWSHVLMDVDRSITPFLTLKVKEASMEPRPDGRG